MLGPVQPWVALHCRAVTIGTELRFLVLCFLLSNAVPGTAQPAASEWNIEIERDLFRNLRQFDSVILWLLNLLNNLACVCLTKILSPPPSSLIGIDYKNIYLQK